MGKPTTDASGGAPATSLFSSVADLLESSMMGMFGTVNGSAGGGRASMSHADGDHLGQKKTGMFVASASPGTSSKQPNTHVAFVYKHGSDSGSQFDMPKLDRLGGNTCPASSEEEEVSGGLCLGFGVFFARVGEVQAYSNALLHHPQTALKHTTSINRKKTC